MNYKLAKQLKDAGFPQGEAPIYDEIGDYIQLQNREYIPNLESLIEACGESFDNLYCASLTDWRAIGWLGSESSNQVEEQGKTPTEAVANLWLKLNPLKV